MTKKVGKAIRAYCSKCAGQRNCEVKGHLPQGGSDDGYDWHVDWYLLSCRGCDYVFAQTIATNSEEYYQGYDPSGEEETVYLETVETWPPRSKRAVPEWFEHSHVETDLQNIGALDASMKELYRALEADLLVLASIGIRTVFDIAAEILGIDPELSFEGKLKKLVADGYILEAEKDNLGILVNAGSASAHRGWKPHANDLDPLMTGLEDFLYNLIVLPSRKRAQAAKLADIDARVPKRPKKEKPPKPKAE